MYKKQDGFQRSYDRAREAAVHKARHTFIEPESLMHLIVANSNFLRLKGLIDQHWATAQEEQDGGYSDRDLWLWSQALRWNE